MAWKLVDNQRDYVVWMNHYDLSVVVRKEKGIWVSFAFLNTMTKELHPDGGTKKAHVAAARKYMKTH